MMLIRYVQNRVRPKLSMVPWFQRREFQAFDISGRLSYQRRSLLKRKEMPSMNFAEC